MDLRTINSIAHHLLGHTSSHEWKDKGNKYYHGLRTAKIAIKLREVILPNDTSHDEIIRVAAWFHDIKNGCIDHEKLGAEKTKKLLCNLCSPYELDEIYELILWHDHKQPNEKNFSDHLKILQDADHLDHFGTYDIWMHCLFSYHNDISLSESLDWFDNKMEKEYAKYRTELNYEISRRIFDEKSAFVQYYGERLKVEANGGIWNLDKLI